MREASFFELSFDKKEKLEKPKWMFDIYRYLCAYKRECKSWTQKMWSIRKHIEVRQKSRRTNWFASILEWIWRLKFCSLWETLKNIIILDGGNVDIICIKLILRISKIRSSLVEDIRAFFKICILEFDGTCKNLKGIWGRSTVEWESGN